MPKLKLGSIIALLVGPFLLIMTYRETTEKKEIARDGIQTMAIPTAKIASRGRRGSRTYKLDVHYAVQGGSQQTARIKVSKGLYDRIDTDPILPIKYLAKNPSKLIVVGEPLENPAMYVVGGVLLVLGVAGTWWYFIRKTPGLTTGIPAKVQNQTPAT
jgi:hypothetical protein